MESASQIAMVGGLVAGYGTFFAMAGRYLYPTGSHLAWLLVATVDEIAPGESLNYESPAGEQVVVRRAAAGSSVDPDDPANAYFALSNVCPHLGCRVHWESNNDRFFCPCHNGAFDPDGIATEGPPKQDGQVLARYEMKVEDNFLYIKMAAEKIATERQG